MLQRAADQQILPDLPGSGPFPASYGQSSGVEFTVYAPIDLAAAAAVRKLPIYAFGNGGCSYDGAAQRFHLADIASYGYVAITPGVIRTGPHAPGGQQTAATLAANPPGPPSFDLKAPRQTAQLLSEAIDWLIAENGREGGPYYNKIDTSRIAVAGGSCGGMLAMLVALEPRVRSLTMFNSGVLTLDASILKNLPPAARAMSSLMPALTKDDLRRLHTPVLYMTGGSEDLAQSAALDDFSRIRNVPVFVADRPHTGHLGIAWDPNAEGTKIEYHWLEYTLFGDRRAGKMFVGKDCSLCRDLVWQVHQHGF